MEIQTGRTIDFCQVLYSTHRAPQQNHFFAKPTRVLARMNESCLVSLSYVPSAVEKLTCEYEEVHRSDLRNAFPPFRRPGSLMLSEVTITENSITSEIDTLDQNWQFMSPVPGWRSYPFRAVACLGQRLLSLICLIATLTVLAAIPGTNLYAMGYLLSAQARIARTGRFRDALILLPAARRMVVVAAATTACLLVIAWLARLVRETWLISSGSLVCWLLTGGLILASTFFALHISRAILRGGTLWEFLRPDRSWSWRPTFRRSDARSHDSPGLNGLLTSLQIRHHMRLGLLNYLAIYAVLALPTWLYTAMQDQSRVAERILFLSGAILLTLVLAFLPFLQVHMAVRENLLAMAECGSAIKRFRNAPGAHLLAVLVLLGLSALVPLYWFPCTRHFSNCNCLPTAFCGT